MSEIKTRSWDAAARIAGLGESAELFAEIAAAAPLAIEAVNREINPGFPAQIRDKIFEGFLNAVCFLAAEA